jgi:PncC family amidohydrolase
VIRNARLDALASELASALGESGSSLSCAESCTGGLAAAAITDIPGASGFFLGGLVAYSNAAKERLLAVPAATIDAHGAVSAETAIAMAGGAASAFGSDYAFSITGIAGPGGGSSDKPVGTVWFGFRSPGSTVSASAFFTGDRQAVRDAAAEFALDRMAAIVRAAIAGSSI